MPAPGLIAKISETPAVPVYSEIRPTAGAKKAPLRSGKQVPTTKNREITKQTLEVETLILKMVNQERKKQGIAPLALDTKLSEIARAHSVDMVRRHFASHVNPEGEDPTDRAKRAGYPTERVAGTKTEGRKTITYYAKGIGENIGETPIGETTDEGYVKNDALSIAQARMKSWMDSPGHKANILNPAYIKIGIGVALDNDRYDKYLATQDFF